MFDFNRAYSQLDEIYLIDFKTSGESDYYHFFTNLNDLLNCLMTTCIYSNKNHPNLATQHDRYAQDSEAYVCMTTSYEGKDRVSNKFGRPFGISFASNTFINLCRSKNYRFNPEVAYNQFGEKADYKIGKEGTAVFDRETFSDFEVFALGELSEGEYFISGGQGPRNPWASVRFYDFELYYTLYEWFQRNLESPLSKHKYYHFVNSNIGTPTQIYKGKPIMVSGNLNKDYRPREDTQKYKEQKHIKGKSYDCTISFDFNGLKFKEIIGIGPIQLYDVDHNNLLLNLQFVEPTTIRGYAGPNLYGKNIETNSFVNKTQYAPGAKKSSQINMIADEATFNKLCDLYNEHEYRVYIPSGKDFRFKTNDILTIVLPASIILEDKIFALDILTKNIANNIFYDTALPDIAFFTTLYENNILSNKITERSSVKAELSRLLKTLINLLQTTYKDVNVEINKAYKKSFKVDKTLAYNADEDAITGLPDKAKQKKSDHTRYLLDNIFPDFSQAQLISWHDDPSVLAPVEIQPNRFEIARIGAETIITGYDTNHKKYVLFVDNAHKSNNFLELPGGGLSKLATGRTALEELAYQRLNFKGGITRFDIEHFIDTQKALVLHEEGVALDKTITWAWSYYRLYSAHYNKILTEDDLSYTYDNTKEAAWLNINGYKAYLKWIPVESLSLNRAITMRYSNIINLIKNN